MYLRILIFGFCAVLLGCVTEIQSTNVYTGRGTAVNKDDIFIDDVQADHVEVEGSAVVGSFNDDDEQSSGDDEDNNEGSADGSGVDPVEVAGGGDDVQIVPVISQTTPELAPAPTNATPSTPSTTMTTEAPTSTDDNLIHPPVTQQTSPSLTDGPSWNTESNDITGMGRTAKERPSSFLSQPGILAAVIGGAVVGLLCAILLVMFIVYRMRKKDEGSYALDEPKRSPRNTSSYQPPNKEFYA